MRDQAFWDRVDHELLENEHIMRTKVRAKRNFNHDGQVKPKPLTLPGTVEDQELRAAYIEYRKTH